MSDTRQNTQIQRADPDYIGSFLNGNIAKIEKAMPADLSTTVGGLFRLYMGVLTLSEQASALQKCSASSVISCVTQGIALGLAPGPLQQVYLIPYSGICTLQVGYRGLASLAHRTDKVKTLYSECVYENDEFYQQRGTDPLLRHVPYVGDRGEMVGAYAVYLGKQGEVDFEHMDMAALNAIKANAHKTNLSSSPYQKWEGEMRRKAPFKRLSKRLDLSPRLSHAVHLDNQAETGVAQDRPDWIDCAGGAVSPSERPSPPGDVEYDQGTQDAAPPAEGKSSEQSTQDGIHAIGRKLYPKTLDAQRHEACLWASNGKTHHIKELEAGDLQRLMTEMQAREKDVANGVPIPGQEVA